MSKEIILHNSKDFFCLIDDEDLDLISKSKWYLSPDGYAARSSHKDGTIKLHRIITGAKEFYDIDHINGNKLDNRKENLRICFHSQNCQNHKKHKNGVTSKYKGVCWYKRDSKWKAHIMFKYKSIHLGYFDNEDDAGRAYDKAAIEFFKEFANLNFK